MSENNEVTKCSFLTESKCPMTKCPYMKTIKIEGTKDCPYLKKSKCPYFNGEQTDVLDIECKDGVCPFKKN